MAACCPKTFTGFCLADNTPIAVTLDNGVVISWTNLVTGVVTPGNPPAGTGICEVPSTVTVDIAPLTCVKDAVTVCQGTTPWVSSLDAPTLAALETVTVLQGTSPWVVNGTVELGVTTLAALETITVIQGTSPWVVSGTVAATQSGVWTTGRTWDLNFATDQVDASGSVVALDAPTLAALETITVLQGTSPWVVTSTDLDIRNLDCLTDSVTVCVVNPLPVALDAPTLAALETITVLQGTSPWVVSGTVAVIQPVAVTDNGGSLTTDNPDIPDLTGTWDYQAGVSGIETIGAGQRVIGIAAHAGIVAGSMTINGGDVIPIPANSSISISPQAQLVAPTIVFTGTTSFFVETVT